MDKKELIKQLKKYQNNWDIETNHRKADELLLMYINDKEIEEEYGKIPKRYA